MPAQSLGQLLQQGYIDMPAQIQWRLQKHEAGAHNVPAGSAGTGFVQHEKDTARCDSTTQGDIVEMLPTFLGVLQQMGKWQLRSFNRRNSSYMVGKSFT